MIQKLDVTWKIQKSDLTWDEYYLNIANEVAKKSKDPSTKVGAVLVAGGKTSHSLGFNGFARGVADYMDRWERPAKYQRVVHAELNAILGADLRIVRDDPESTLYVTHSVCSECAKAVIQAGVKRVVIGKGKFASDWDEKTDFALDMMREARVEVVVGNVETKIND
jgi:dCMP deaminase